MNLELIIQEEFPQQSDMIYLNHAGVSPWPKCTANAIKAFAEENIHHGPVNYKHWLRIELELRERLRELLNAPSIDDIALLKNTSEGLSVVAYGLLWKQGENIVTSNQEFPSNRIVWESLASKGVELRQADLDSGVSPEEALFSLVDEKTRIITISSVQYATGLRMDLKRIGEFCKNKNILFCVDAIQSLGALQMDVQEIDADFVVADGHKWMMGPEGVAVFYTTPESRDRLTLNQFGWHMIERAGDYDTQEWEVARSAKRFECGSPNMLGIFGLNASLSLILETGIDQVEARIMTNSACLVDAFSKDSDIQIVTPSEPKRHAGIFSFRKRSRKLQEVYNRLAENGVHAALRGNAIRLSPHFYNRTIQMEQCVNVVHRM
ncbi:MAG: aminotransferase class V-fold PLP-dependent enzyme [Gammaproteobacteria bacterium]